MGMIEKVKEYYGRYYQVTDLFSKNKENRKKAWIQTGKATIITVVGYGLSVAIGNLIDKICDKKLQLRKQEIDESFGDYKDVAKHEKDALSGEYYAFGCVAGAISGIVIGIVSTILTCKILKKSK